MENQKLKIEITELFMAKADWKRCFSGSIKREKDEKENPVLSGKIFVKNDKFNEVIYAQVSDSAKSNEKLQDQLGEQLDEIVKMILDCGLTKLPAVREKIGEIDYFLN